MTDIMKTCKTHGEAPHRLRRDNGVYRCRKCQSEQVTRRRRKVKATLVSEHGGKCQLCGYNRYVGSLDFHHIDPSTKEFGLSSNGVTYGIDRMRAEAAKCILLCRNCHGEVEAGVVDIPVGQLLAVARDC
jgi:5-methylcytosine-specific restriction endonuclease McrA